MPSNNSSSNSGSTIEICSRSIRGKFPVRIVETLPISHNGGVKITICSCVNGAIGIACLFPAGYVAGKARGAKRDLKRLKAARRKGEILE